MTDRRDVPEHLRVKREPHRGVYDRATIDAILDEALVCHLGFEVDGQPYVIPTLHARIDDRLYVHGSAASRALRHAASDEMRVCVTVTLLDGLVLARSVFNHSINYRSVVVLGTATGVEGDERVEALRAFTEHIAPGRWEEARQPTAQELKATWILSLPLDEASAKVRSGPPEDDPEDLDFPAWSGIVPVHLAAEPSEYDWRRVRDGRLGPPRT
jgi:nitroimidazol reductase NimA-like FMN-containing flavoprotein (pyridoxamine 5'-phosphate oxidase superfamily)